MRAMRLRRTVAVLGIVGVVGALVGTMLTGCAPGATATEPDSTSTESPDPLAWFRPDPEPEVKHPDGSEDRPFKAETKDAAYGDYEAHWVELPTGKSVLCVSFVRGGTVVSISCDYANQTTAP